MNILAIDLSATSLFGFLDAVPRENRVLVDKNLPFEDRVSVAQQYIENYCFGAVMVGEAVANTGCDFKAIAFIRAIRATRPIDVTCRKPPIIFIGNFSPKTHSDFLNAGANVCLPTDSAAGNSFFIDPRIVTSQLQSFDRLLNQDAQNKFAHLGIEIKEGVHDMSFMGAHLHLTPSESQILKMLINANGKAVSRQSIFERLYPLGDVTDEKIIDVYMCKIRKKLADILKARGLDEKTAIIDTSRGIGYLIATHNLERVAASLANPQTGGIAGPTAGVLVEGLRTNPTPRPRFGALIS